VGLVAGVAWHWLGFVLPKLLQVQLFADFVEQLLRHFAELLKWQLPVGSVLVAVEAWDPGVQGRSARKLPLPAEATQVQMLLESPVVSPRLLHSEAAWRPRPAALLPLASSVELVLADPADGPQSIP